MASEITRIGERVLIDGTLFRVRRFQLTSNRKEIKAHVLTFVLEVERKREYHDDEKPTTPKADTVKGSTPHDQKIG